MHIHIKTLLPKNIHKHRDFSKTVQKTIERIKNKGNLLSNKKHLLPLLNFQTQTYPTSIVGRFAASGLTSLINKCYTKHNLNFIVLPMLEFYIVYANIDQL